MPDKVIPFALNFTARGWSPAIGSSRKDQQLINGLYVTAPNSLKNTNAIYCQKRSGSTTGSTIGASVRVLKHYSSKFSAMYSSSGTIFSGTTSIGTAGSGPIAAMNGTLCDAIISDIGVLAFIDDNAAGWYVYANAITSNFPTFTADTHTNTTIDNIGGTGAATTGIYVGQKVSGTGIPADTRVATVGANSFTITNPATGTATITVTKEALSKIIDADFPSGANSIDFLDGYFQVGTNNGKIYQSAINDPSSWASGDFVSADYSGDGITVIFRWLSMIVAAGARGTIQFFYNAGNPTGSVLSAAENLNLTGLILLVRPMVVDGVGYVVGFPSSSSTTDGHSLYAMTGANTFTRVSDDEVDLILSIINTSTTRIESAIIGQKPLLLFIGTSGSTNALAFDLKTKQFSVVTLASADITSSFNRTFTKSGSTASFTWDENNPTNWQDSGAAYTMTCQTEPIDVTNGFGCTDISIELLADVEASGTAALDVSDDDYATWESMGTFDMTQTQKIIWGCGWHPGPRAYRVTHLADTPFRAQGLKLIYSPGGGG